MKSVHQFTSFLKVMGAILALIGLLPAVPGIAQAASRPPSADAVTAAGSRQLEQRLVIGRYDLLIPTASRAVEGK